MTFVFIVGGAKLAISFFKRSDMHGYNVEPLDNTVLAYESIMRNTTKQPKLQEKNL